MKGFKRASISFGYRIEREDGGLLADGSTVHAFTDADGKIVRVPEPFLVKTGLGKHHFTEGRNRGKKPGA